MNRANRGFTIVEVVVATLIMAMTTFGLFAAILSARRTQSSSDRRQLAAFYVHMARERLTNYVIAFNTPPGRPVLQDLQALAANIGGGPCTAINNCPSATFTGGALDTCGAVHWALYAGCIHDYTPYLPGSFTGGPFNGTLTYIVANGGPTGTESKVTFTVNWTEITP